MNRRFNDSTNDGNKLGNPLNKSKSTKKVYVEPMFINHTNNAEE